MARDLVSERRHRKNLKRKAVRQYKLRENKDGGTWKSDRMRINESWPVRDPQPKRGPKKHKWKRDVLNRGR